VEVPVGVVTTNAILISGLKADSFVVSESKTAMAVRAATYDTGPRRIVFVVDKGSRLRGSASKIVGSVVEKILQSARNADTFGVVFADHLSIPIGDPSSVLTRFREFMGQDRSKNGDLIETLSEANELFQSPRLGDSIFLFAGDDRLEQGHGDYNKIYNLLCEKRIRVFGMLFGFYLMGSYSTLYVPDSNPAGQGSHWDTAFFSEDRTVHSLTWGTGGYYKQEATEEPQYKLTDERLQATTSLGLQMYGAVAEFYRLQVDSSSSRSRPQPWRLKLSSMTPNSQNKHVLYPRRLPRCESK
jgi:hypothetical protein